MTRRERRGRRELDSALGVDPRANGWASTGKKRFQHTVCQCARSGQCEHSAGSRAARLSADQREDTGNSHPQEPVVGCSREPPHHGIERGRLQCASAFHPFDVGSDKFSVQVAHPATLCRLEMLSSRDATGVRQHG